MFADLLVILLFLLIGYIAWLVIAAREARIWFELYRSMRGAENEKDPWFKVPVKRPE